MELPVTLSYSELSDLPSLEAKFDALKSQSERQEQIMNQLDAYRTQHNNFDMTGAALISAGGISAFVTGIGTLATGLRFVPKDEANPDGPTKPVWRPKDPKINQRWYIALALSALLALAGGLYIWFWGSRLGKLDDVWKALDTRGGHTFEHRSL